MSWRTLRLQGAWGGQLPRLSALRVSPHSWRGGRHWQSLRRDRDGRSGPKCDSYGASGLSVLSQTLKCVADPHSWPDLHSHLFEILLGHQPQIPHVDFLLSELRSEVREVESAEELLDSSRFAHLRASNRMFTSTR